MTPDEEGSMNIVLERAPRIGDQIAFRMTPFVSDETGLHVDVYIEKFDEDTWKVKVFLSLGSIIDNS